MFKRIAFAGFAAMAALSGCTDGYGYGGGVAYLSDYGYGYPGYGYAGYPAYYGWYGDYYYPGTGIYVYDRYRRPYRWTAEQERYWLARRGYGYPGGRAEYREDRRELRGNWRDFARDQRADTRAFYQERRADRQELRSGQLTPDQYRAERQQARQAYRQDYRQDVRDLRRANRRAIRD